MSGALVARLERPLPSPLPVGTATAVFCLGVCFHRGAPVEDLELVVDGVAHRPAAFGMPRPDVGEAHRSDPQSYSHRSGFWATIPIQARDRPGKVELQAAVRLAGGAEARASLGGIEIVEREPPRSSSARPARSGPGLIAVCMATFDPDPALLRAQIDSLRAQTDDRWICVISDDCSGDERFARLREVVGDDPRFEISRSGQRLGFYRNFERAMAMAPAEAELVALCDQDDRWHPDKLEVLRGALGDAQLVYSDQRLVDAQGRVLRETLWQGRRNNHTDLASMLIANTITGAATLFRRELAELMLPFPDTPGFQFHDHWLGVAALATGEVAYVDRPLYDYVQHAGAVFGDVSQGAKSSRAKGAWRAGYFYGFLSREVQAQTLLVRCPDRLSPRKRRVLERFVASSRSPVALAWLSLRPARELLGRNETLGSEAQLARGVLWKWLTALRARRGKAPHRILGDAGFPPPTSFNQKRLRRWRART